MKTILVPVDFSDVTEAVVDAAAQFARSLGGNIVLLHVAAPEPDFVGYGAGPDVVRENVAAGLHRERREMEKIEARLKRRGLVAVALMFQGPTVQKILREAGRLKAALIVMGSHGHGALHDLLVGSVTEGVLRKAPCPVLLIPSRRLKTRR